MRPLWWAKWFEKLNYQWKKPIYPIVVRLSIWKKHKACMGWNVAAVYGRVMHTDTNIFKSSRSRGRAHYHADRLCGWESQPYPHNDNCLLLCSLYLTTCSWTYRLDGDIDITKEFLQRRLYALEERQGAFELQQISRNGAVNPDMFIWMRSLSQAFAEGTSYF